LFQKDIALLHLPNGFISEGRFCPFMALLAVDVGAGTQDILLFEEDLRIENSAKMVMPSMTVIVGKLIDGARLRRRDVFLAGTTMGGGESVRAVKRHIEAKLRVFASPKAALTLHDDLERVKTMGVQIAELVPPEAEVVEMGDIDLLAIKGALESFGLEMPEDMAVAVQDHGFSPDRSNRIVRFEEMAKVLDSSRPSAPLQPDGGGQGDAGLFGPSLHHHGYRPGGDLRRDPGPSLCRASPGIERWKWPHHRGGGGRGQDDGPLRAPHFGPDGG
jgi:hypothetical protein